MCLGVVGGVFMYFLADFDPFVEAVGFMAVFTEAMLGVPQFYRNAKNKSTYGMRYGFHDKYKARFTFTCTLQ